MPAGAVSGADRKPTQEPAMAHPKSVLPSQKGSADHGQGSSSARAAVLIFMTKR